MADEYGPTFITVTDEDGREIVLEFVDALEYNGQQYQAFFPAETEGEDEDDPDNGLVILKVLHEDGEDLLSTLDSDEELDAVAGGCNDVEFMISVGTLGAYCLGRAIDSATGNGSAKEHWGEGQILCNA